MEQISKMSAMGGSKPLSGLLYKYTNVMKGWQRRWFTVDAEAGLLSYYLCEGGAPSPSEPARGEAHLDAAVVCPSDEDSRTFTINCASGDMLKLRAVDARARQEWVDGLRAIAESHSSERLPPRERLAARNAMTEVRRQLHEAELSHAALARAIEAAVPPFSHADHDLLLLKATSAAGMQCLLHCLGILHRQQQTGPVHISHNDPDADSVF